MTHDPYRSISGEVLYLHDEKGQIGHEEFTITQDGSSHRTLRARCEIYEEGLLRDVTYTVDQNWTPQENCAFDPSLLPSAMGGALAPRFHFAWL